MELTKSSICLISLLYSTMFHAKPFERNKNLSLENGSFGDTDVNNLLMTARRQNDDCNNLNEYCDSSSEEYYEYYDEEYECVEEQNKSSHNMALKGLVDGGAIDFKEDGFPGLSTEPDSHVKEDHNRDALYEESNDNHEQDGESDLQHDLSAESPNKPNYDGDFNNEHDNGKSHNHHEHNDGDEQNREPYPGGDNTTEAPGDLNNEGDSNEDAHSVESQNGINKNGEDQNGEDTHNEEIRNQEPGTIAKTSSTAFYMVTR